MFHRNPTSRLAVLAVLAKLTSVKFAPPMIPWADASPAGRIKPSKVAAIIAKIATTHLARTCPDLLLSIIPCVPPMIECRETRTGQQHLLRSFKCR
jgi:hypothetical protein